MSEQTAGLKPGEAEGVSSAAIEFHGVRKAFGRAGQRRVVLRSLSLTIDSGEFLVVAGRSGCGKTTLLRIAAGLTRPSSGQVYVHGDLVKGTRSDIGIVFQRPVLLPWKRVIDNVLLPVVAGDLKRETPRKMRTEYRNRAEELLALTGLEGWEGHYPAELSGGMQQRVSICRALITHPKALLMDEPFAALDALTREELSVELSRISSELGITTLFITHSVSEAVFLASRVVVLRSDGGEVAAVVDVPSARPRPQQALSDSRAKELEAVVRTAIESAPVLDSPDRKSEV